jgi:hypothetical protein
MVAHQHDLQLFSHDKKEILLEGNREVGRGNSQLCDQMVVTTSTNGGGDGDGGN